MRRYRRWLPVSIVGLLVTAAVALAALLQVLAVSPHARAMGVYLGAGVALPPAYAMALGTLLVVAVAGQLMLASKYLPIPASRLPRAHRAVAYGVVALLLAHAALAVIHALRLPASARAGWSIGLGLLVALVLAELMVAGGRVKGARERRGHALLAVGFAAAIVVHAAVGLLGVLGV